MSSWVWQPLLPGAADLQSSTGITGSGVLLAQNAVIDGDGISSSTGTGALAAQASQIDGAGLSVSTGTGVLLAQAADITGAGVTQWAAAGVLLAQAADITGAGLSISTGAGALVAQNADVDGVGEVVVNEIIGAGALVAQNSTMLGLGELGQMEVRIEGARRPRFLTRIKKLFYWYDDESELPQDEPDKPKAKPKAAVAQPPLPQRAFVEPTLPGELAGLVQDLQESERAEIARRAQIKRNNEAIMMMMH